MNKKSNIMNIFSKNLKRLRLKKGWSQEELAEKCNTTSNYISQMESGHRFASATNLDVIIEALDISPFELFIDNYTDRSKDTKKKFSKNLIDTINIDLEKLFEDYEII